MFWLFSRLIEYNGRQSTNYKGQQGILMILTQVKTAFLRDLTGREKKCYL